MAQVTDRPGSFSEEPLIPARASGKDFEKNPNKKDDNKRSMWAAILLAILILLLILLYSRKKGDSSESEEVELTKVTSAKLTKDTPDGPRATAPAENFLGATETTVTPEEEGRTQWRWVWVRIGDKCQWVERRYDNDSHFTPTGDEVDVENVQVQEKEENNDDHKNENEDQKQKNKEEEEGKAAEQKSKPKKGIAFWGCAIITIICLTLAVVVSPIALVNGWHRTLTDNDTTNSYSLYLIFGTLILMFVGASTGYYCVTILCPLKHSGSES